MVPNQIWIPTMVELLPIACKRAVKLMVPMPKIPTVHANLRGLTSTMSSDEGLRIKEKRSVR
jgi:hypothetical protein